MVNSPNFIGYLGAGVKRAVYATQPTLLFVLGYQTPQVNKFLPFVSHCFFIRSNEIFLTTTQELVNALSSQFGDLAYRAAAMLAADKGERDLNQSSGGGGPVRLGGDRLKFHARSRRFSATEEAHEVCFDLFVVFI